MTSASNQSKIAYTEDKYDGIIIDPASLHQPVQEFEKNLTELIASQRDKYLIWITLPIDKSVYLPVFTKHGFIFYDCNETEIILLKKLAHDPIMPTPTNHTIGVGVFVRDGENMLVVKDRIYRSYKLPGGYVDHAENISQAVVREVAEETGIAVKMEAIVSIGHFSPCQFNESNMYLVCKATPLTTDIRIVDTQEIIEARWIEIDRYINHENVHPYNKKIVTAAIHNRGIKPEDCDFFLSQKNRHEFFF
jgi:8-oxo-dGTP diphosphatase